MKKEKEKQELVNYKIQKKHEKWEAAKNFCDDRLWEFKIMTEKELGIK